MIRIQQNRVFSNIAFRSLQALVICLFYILLIFGIFILQFNNETIIHRKIGDIQVSLREIKANEGHTVLQNNLVLNYRGITVVANKNNPAQLYHSDGHSELLVLESWQVLTNLTSVRFFFSQGVTFTVIDRGAGEGMLFSANLPGSGIALMLNYRPEENYAIVEQNMEHTVIGSRIDRFVLNAPSDASQMLVLRGDSPAVSYRPVQPESALSFEAVAGLELASEVVYRSTKFAIEEHLITAFEASPALADEGTILSYMAALGERNLRARAFANVPPSFLNPEARTYRSGPYFDSMVQMNRSLQTDNAAFMQKLEDAIQNHDADVFTIDNLGDYLFRGLDPEKVTAFLLIPAMISNFDPTIAQSVGIINVYSTLLEASNDNSSFLEPVIAKCLAKIAALGSLDNGRFILRDQGAQLGLFPSVEAGAALIRYADVRQSPMYGSAGRLIVNSLCSGQESTFDLATLETLYRLLNPGNRYYPHSAFITTFAGTPIWAWSVAQSVGYSVDALRRLTLTFDYPLGESHYVFISGLPPFRAIEIYNIPYHSDPRFETYSASGFIYDTATSTLLLKVQQRSRREAIRFTY
jgi:hypothetical protein